MKNTTISVSITTSPDKIQEWEQQAADAGLTINQFLRTKIHGYDLKRKEDLKSD